MTKSFAQSRIESVDSNDENAKELLTDDETTLTSVLELAATMARVNYKDAAEFIVGLFDGCAAQYNELFIASNTGNAVASPEFLRRLEYVECKLSWMVYYMGACVGARSPMQISEEQENLDGEIVSKILQLVNVDGNFVPRLREMGHSINRTLDLAILYFFFQFRKVYVGPHMDVRQGREIYVRLGETFGIDDQNKMLNLIVQKMFSPSLAVIC
ncbi:Exportin 7 [Entophlyctis luteolus]|nr:Exportin 7 [Entophlyctis luteolus]